MLRHGPVALFFIALAATTFAVGSYIYLPPLLYLVYAIVWSVILFCGCYFIGWQYFIRSVCRAATTEKIAALSFDDGPVSSTDEVLAILKEKEVEAAFFFIGRRLEGREELCRQVVGEGHIIGNHSFSHHPLFDLFSLKKMRADLLSMASATQEITGRSPLLFRPPFGVTNPTVAAAVKSAGYISVGWNLRTYDTMQKSPDKLRKKILRGLKPGGIILLHDSTPITVETLPLIIDDIHAAGYRLVRLDKMCNLTAYA